MNTATLVVAAVLCGVSAAPAHALTLYGNVDADGAATWRYTVFNEGLDELHGVHVSIDGLTFADVTVASAPFDEASGVWIIGDLAPGESRVLALDAATVPGSASALGWTGLARVSATAPTPARYAEADAEWFADDVAADPSEPEVLAAVARVGADPTALAAWVGDSVRFEPYAGSLRGARGTLWDSAGNAWDQASLLVAMLRATGTPARFREASLDASAVTARIASAFVARAATAAPSPTRDALIDALMAEPLAIEALREQGLPTSGAAARAALEAALFVDEASDPSLRAQVEDHVVVEAFVDGAWVVFDPTGAGASPGDAVWGTVPDPTRHMAQVTVFAEVINPAFTPLGTETQVLDTSIPVAAIIGAPVFLRQDAQVFNRGGLVFGSVERRYTPVLEFEGAELARGVEYVELATNFPLASQYLFGVSVDVTLRGPNGVTATLEHRISDRLGTAARTGLGGDVALTFSTAGAMSGMAATDVVALHVAASALPAYAPGRWRGELAKGQARLQAVFPALQAIVDASEDGMIRNADDRAAYERANALAIDNNRALAAWLGTLYHEQSARLVDVAAADALVTAFDAQPRLAIVGVLSTDAGPAPYVSLARHEVATLTPPDIPASNERMFRLARGIAEADLEGWIVEQWGAADEVVSMRRVLEAAERAGVQMRELGPDDIATLALFDLPPDAVAAITVALLDGRDVVVPEQAVVVAGREAVMWWEYDPTTGSIESVAPNGYRMAAVQYSTITSSILTEGFGIALGGLHGLSSGTLAGLAQVLSGTISKTSLSSMGTGALKCVAGKQHPGIGGAIAIYDQDLASLLMAIFEYMSPDPGVAKFIGGFSFGFCMGSMLASARVAYYAAAAGLADPPLRWGYAGAVPSLRRPPNIDHVTWPSATESAPALGALGVGDRLDGAIELSGDGVALSGLVRVVGSGSLEVDGTTVRSGTIDLLVDRAQIDGTVTGAINGAFTQVGDRLAGPTRAATLAATGDIAVMGWGGDADAVGVVRGAAFTVEAWGADIALRPTTLSVADARWSSGDAAWNGVDGTFDPIDGAFTGARGAWLRVPSPGIAALADGGFVVSWTPASSDAADLDVWVEAPSGWDAVFVAPGEVEVRPGPDAGAGPLALWARSADGRVAGVEAPLGFADDPGVFVSVAHTPLFTQGWAGFALPTVFQVRVRTGDCCADGVPLATDVTAGFEVIGAPATVPAGAWGDVTLLVGVAPLASELPSPGTTVTLEVTAGEGALRARADDSITFGPMVSAQLRFEPDFLALGRGDSALTELVVTGDGTGAGTVAIDASTSARVTFVGMPATVDVVPGETQRFEVFVGVTDDAVSGLSYGTLVRAWDGEVLLDATTMSVAVLSPAGALARSVADDLDAVGDPTSADELRTLGGTLDALDEVCTSGLASELVFRLRALSVSLDEPGYEWIAADLWTYASTVASSTDPCGTLDAEYIGAVIEQIGDVAAQLDAELGERVLVGPLSAETSVVSGEDVAITWAVQNIGDAASAPVELDLTVVCGGSEAERTVVRVPPIDAGDTWNAELTWSSEGVLGGCVITVDGPRNRRWLVVGVTPGGLAPPTNRPPTITGGLPERAQIGVELAWPLTVDDSDGDAWLLTATTLPPGLRLDDTTLRGTPRTEGSWPIILAATDRYGATSLAEGTFAAVWDLSNISPVIASVPPRRVSVGDTWTYEPQALDADGDSVTWTLRDAPTGMVLDAAPRLTWTPGPDDVGDAWITLEADDGAGGVVWQSFPLTVVDEPPAPDLVAYQLDAADVVWTGRERGGTWTVGVANVGSAATTATSVVIYVEADALAGFTAGDEPLATLPVPALAPGESFDADVDASGVAAFAGAPAWAHVDPDGAIAEIDESNNVVASFAGVQTLQAYSVARPVGAEVVLVSPGGGGYRVLDPVTGRGVDEGVLEPATPTLVSPQITTDDGTFDLLHFAVESAAPVQIYVLFEIFDPDFGADLIHPATDGASIGREFVVYVPTSTGNNALVVTALEPATIERFDAAGVLVTTTALNAGQWWEPDGVASGDVLRLSSTGDLIVQSASVTGLSAIPPASLGAARLGDVGRLFRFATRARGLGGGAVAVFGYEDAEYVVRTYGGGVLLRDTVAAGAVRLHVGVGELRGASLESTGDVAVWAGDVSRAGADTLALLGEDLLQTRGDGGRAFVVHTQRQDAADSAVLAGPEGALLRVDGVEVSLGPWGRLALADDALVTVQSTRPVVVQTMGGGDRYFDYGVIARRINDEAAPATAVLEDVVVDESHCASRVRVSARVANAGGSPIGSDAGVTVHALDASGERLVGALSLGARLDAGTWRDISFEVEPLQVGASATWVVRFAAPGAAQDATVVVPSAPSAGGCSNAAPSFVSAPPSSVAPDETLDYLARAVDPEGEPVRYTWIDGPAGASLEPGTGRLRWTARTGLPRVAFTLGASDPQGATTVQSFEVTILGVDACPPGLDGDSDGWCPPDDCDDGRPDVRPDAVEILGDGVDNDCDDRTPDSVPPSAASLSIGVAETNPAPGEAIRVAATVTNRGTRDALGVGRIELSARCAGDAAPAWTTTLDAPTIAPSSDVQVDGVWDTTVGRRGSCAIQGLYLIDGVALALDGVTVTFGGDVSGTIQTTPTRVLPGATASVAWGISNVRDASWADTVSVRRADRLTPIDEALVTLDPLGIADGTFEVDTVGWSRATHRLELVAGGAVVAATDLIVADPARAEAIFVADADVVAGIDAADGVGISWRATGPVPLGEGLGGVLQAAWHDDTLAVRVTPLPVAATDNAQITVRVSRDGARVAEASWQRVGGFSGDGTGAVLETARGSGVTFAFDAGATGFGPGEMLGLQVEVALPEPSGAATLWAWSAAETAPTGASDEDGVLVLLDRTGGGGDAGTDAGGTDAGGSDAGTDAGGTDAGVDTGIDGGADAGGEAGADAGIDASGADTERDGGGDAQDGAGGGVRGNGKSGCSAAPAPGGATLLLLGAGALLLARRRRRALALVTAAAMLGACSGSNEREGEVNPGTDAGADTSPGDAGGGDASDTAPDALPDVGGDVSEDTDAGVDAPGDTGPGADAQGSWPDAPPVEGAETGSPCSDDDACASGICQQAGDWSVCTELCSEDEVCPDGFSCERFPGGASICVAIDVCVDLDEDGYGLGRGCDGLDCDDADALRFVGADELCNGVDDDCDGEIDEGLRNACGTCGLAPVEVCNGLDDDCNGEVDEAVLNACGGCGAVDVEVCNGIDDDCDGAVDDGVCPECTFGEERPCYGGPPGTEGVGACVGGRQVCDAAGWSDCLDDVIPSAEACNGVDDDCDGDVDELLLNVCGTCGPPPAEVCNGVDDDCDGDIDEGVQSACGGCTPCGELLVFPDETGDRDPAIAPAPDGAITLGTGLLERHFIWIPNSLEGSVSRFNTQTGREEARYYVGDDPSRTAVDLDGNAWVGNRGDGLATHIFGRLDDCIDRNGDGVIQTSRDLNGDGRITGAELLPEAALDPLADECVHCQVRVGNATDLVRGVGVDADNFAWLGTWNSRELYRVDPDTCEIVTQMSTGEPGTGANASSIYGLVIDANGQLFTSTYSARCITQVDTATQTVVDVNCDWNGRRYGIAPSPDGRIWYGTEGSTLTSYDPETRTWASYQPPAEQFTLALTAGLVVDNGGIVWVTDYNTSSIVRYDPYLDVWSRFRTNEPPAGFSSQTNPRGVTIDAEGDIWAICRGSSALVEFNTDGDWLGVYETVNATTPSQGTSPYSYSDNTGFQLFNIVAREGEWSQRFDVAAPVQFVRLEAQAFLPEGTAVAFAVRAAPDVTLLEDAEYSAFIAATDIDLRPLVGPGNSVIEVRARLTTDDPSVRPVLRDVRVYWETPDCRLAGNVCPGGQLCEPVFGGCIIPPAECFADTECGAFQFCDATGVCRVGCRAGAVDACPVGQSCDRETRVCTSIADECGDDAECPAGAYCTDAGQCVFGCRLEPDNCPPRFVCDGDTRDCVPEAPECVIDGDCDSGRFCDEGLCLTGCRVDGSNCAVDERCDASARRCEPLPEACDPGAISDEVCNGLDDDCNGEVDDATVDTGTSCAAGERLVGTLVCAGGRPMCRADLDASVMPGSYTQWASTATATSAWSTNNRQAWRATGVADVNACRTANEAWRPSATGADPEALTLSFATPVYATGVRVLETQVGGFVTQIDLVTIDGDVIESVWSGVDETLCGAWFEPTWPATTSLITGVIIHTEIAGSEEIDAVQLVGESPVAPRPEIEGVLTDVILPAAEYHVYGNVTFAGASIIEPGTTLLAPRGRASTLTHNGTGDDVWSGVTVDQHAINWQGTGDVTLTDFVMRGSDVDTTTLTLGSFGETRVAGGALTDVTTTVDGGTSARLEFVRMDVTDTRVRWLLTSNGDTQLYGVEAYGALTVPRRTDGAQVRSSGSLSVERSRFENFETAIYAWAGGPFEVSDSRVVASDRGVVIVGGTPSALHATTFDLSDPGHVGIGLLFESLGSAGGGVFEDLEFLLSVRDRAARLDPDVFHVASPMVMQRWTVDGRPRDEALTIQGDMDAGELRIEPVDGIATFQLDSQLTVSAGATLEVDPGMTLRSDDVTLWRRIRLLNTSTATFDGVTFANIGFSVDAGANLVMRNSEMAVTYPSRLYLLDVAGAAEVTNTEVVDPSALAGATPVHYGARAFSSGQLVVSGSSFRGMDIGILSEDSARSTISGTLFEGCLYGLWLQEASSNTVTSCTFVDDDPARTSTGIELRFTDGQVTVNGATFDLGDEDRPMSLEPDAFRDDLATPTTITGLTFVDGRMGRGIGLRGESITGSITFTPIDGIGTFSAYENVTVRAGAQAVIRDGVTIEGDASGRIFDVWGAGSRLEIEPGATFRNIEIYASAEVVANGATFDSSDTRARNLVRVLGTFDATDSTFTGADRRPFGVRVLNGGSATLTRGVLSGMNYGVVVESGGSAQLTDAEVEDSGTAVRLQGAATFVGDRLAVTGGFDLAMLGVHTTNTPSGLSLTLTDTAFSLGSTDAPFLFETLALVDTNTVDVTGSSFVGGEQGNGYQLFGRLDAGTASLNLLEPAHSTWTLIGDVSANNDASLTATGASFTSTVFRLLDAYSASSMALDRVNMHNVGAQWRGTATGSIANSTLVADLRGRFQVVRVSSPSSVTVENNTIESNGEANDSWGVYTSGAAGAACSVTGNVFRTLRYGVYVGSGTTPTLTSNTFEGCVDDTFLQ